MEPVTHHCHAEACRAPCKPEFLMCGPHWRLVPKPIQNDVYLHYRVGQCDDKRPSEAWHHAADAAIAYVAVYENRWTQERANAWLRRHEPKGPKVWVTSVKQGMYLNAFTPGGPVDKPAPNVPFVYVGRRLGQYHASLLGNPFRNDLLAQADDGNPVVRYKAWLQEKLVIGSPEMEELLRIMRLGLEPAGVVLGCWCAPDPICHANEIRDAVRSLWGVGWR